MTKIYLIRHAESEGNAYRRAHGHYNGRIVEMGFKQIDALRKRFENERVDCIYSSDLDRTCTTATALSEPRNLAINKTEKLREVCMGIWEGLAWGDLEHTEPEMVKSFGVDPAKWSAEGSESYEQVQSRMLECLCDIGKRHEGETVAAFSHGFAIKALICKILALESHESSKIPYCDNTAVTSLIYDNGALSIEYQGDNSHLSDDISTFFRQTWWRLSGEKIKENLRYTLIDSIGELACLKHGVLEAIAVVDFDMAFLGFLDMEPVGVIALDSGGDTFGSISYYFVKPEHKDRNFLDQLLGQAISVFREHGKKSLRIEVPAHDEALNTFFSSHGFNKVAASNDVNLLEKNIIVKN